MIVWSYKFFDPVQDPYLVQDPLPTLPDCLANRITFLYYLIQIFQSASETLEKIQKNLEDYLETKRIGFPRQVLLPVTFLI